MAVRPARHAVRSWLMPMDAFFGMWRLVIAEFGIAACDKGDTLYWRWQQ